MASIVQATLRAAEMVRSLGGEGGNPLKALVAYFEPIFQDLEGQVFDATNFSDRVRQAYGWNFNKEAAEGFRATFRSLKYLELQRDQTGQPLSNDGVPVDRIRAPKSNKDAENEEKFGKIIDAIIESFRLFVSKIEIGSAYQRTDEQITTNIVTWLLNTFDKNTLDYELEDEDDPGQLKKDQDRYLIARWVKDVISSGGAVTQGLEEIYCVGLLAELADEFNSPVRKVKKSDAIVFLDSPVALDLLGTSGLAPAESTRAIIGKLQELGMRVEVLHKTRQELVNTLFAVVKSDPDDRTGPTADALMSGEVEEAFLWSIINDPAHALKPFGVSVRSKIVDENVAASDFFNSSDYDKLGAYIPT